MIFDASTLKKSSVGEERCGLMITRFGDIFQCCRKGSCKRNRRKHLFGKGRILRIPGKSTEQNSVTSNFSGKVESVGGIFGKFSTKVFVNCSRKCHSIMQSQRSKDCCDVPQEASKQSKCANNTKQSGFSYDPCGLSKLHRRFSLEADKADAPVKCEIYASGVSEPDDVHAFDEAPRDELECDSLEHGSEISSFAGNTADHGTVAYVNSVLPESRNVYMLGRVTQLESIGSTEVLNENSQSKETIAPISPVVLRRRPVMIYSHPSAIACRTNTVLELAMRYNALSKQKADTEGGQNRKQDLPGGPPSTETGSKQGSTAVACLRPSKLGDNTTKCVSNVSLTRKPNIQADLSSAERSDGTKRKRFYISLNSDANRQGIIASNSQYSVVNDTFTSNCDPELLKHTSEYQHRFADQNVSGTVVDRSMLRSTGNHRGNVGAVSIKHSLARGCSSRLLRNNFTSDDLTNAFSGSSNREVSMIPSLGKHSIEKSVENMSDHKRKDDKVVVRCAGSRSTHYDTNHTDRKESDFHCSANSKCFANLESEATQHTQSITNCQKLHVSNPTKQCESKTRIQQDDNQSYLRCVDEPGEQPPCEFGVYESRQTLVPRCSSLHGNKSIDSTVEAINHDVKVSTSGDCLSDPMPQNSTSCTITPGRGTSSRDVFQPISDFSSSLLDEIADCLDGNDATETGQSMKPNWSFLWQCIESDVASSNGPAHSNQVEPYKDDTCMKRDLETEGGHCSELHGVRLSHSSYHGSNTLYEEQPLAERTQEACTGASHSVWDDDDEGNSDEFYETMDENVYESLDTVRAARDQNIRSDNTHIGRESIQEANTQHLGDTPPLPDRLGSSPNQCTSTGAGDGCSNRGGHDGVVRASYAIVSEDQPESLCYLDERGGHALLSTEIVDDSLIHRFTNSGEEPSSTLNSDSTRSKAPDIDSTSVQCSLPYIDGDGVPSSSPDKLNASGKNAPFSRKPSVRRVCYLRRRGAGAGSGGGRFCKRNSGGNRVQRSSQSSNHDTCKQPTNTSDTHECLEYLLDFLLGEMPEPLSLSSSSTNCDTPTNTLISTSSARSFDSHPCKLSKPPLISEEILISGSAAKKQPDQVSLATIPALVRPVPPPRPDKLLARRRHDNNRQRSSTTAPAVEDRQSSAQHNGTEVVVDSSQLVDEKQVSHPAGQQDTAFASKPSDCTCAVVGCLTPDTGLTDKNQADVTSLPLPLSSQLQPYAEQRLTKQLSVKQIKKQLSRMMGDAITVHPARYDSSQLSRDAKPLYAGQDYSDDATFSSLQVDSLGIRDRLCQDDGRLIRTGSLRNFHGSQSSMRCHSKSNISATQSKQRIKPAAATPVCQGEAVSVSSATSSIYIGAASRSPSPRDETSLYDEVADNRGGTLKRSNSAMKQTCSESDYHECQEFSLWVEKEADDAETDKNEWADDEHIYQPLEAVHKQLQSAPSCTTLATATAPPALSNASNEALSTAGDTTHAQHVTRSRGTCGEAEHARHGKLNLANAADGVKKKLKNWRISKSAANRSRSRSLLPDVHLAVESEASDSSAVSKKQRKQQIKGQKTEAAADRSRFYLGLDSVSTATATSAGDACGGDGEGGVTTRDKSDAMPLTSFLSNPAGTDPESDTTSSARSSTTLEAVPGSCTLVSVSGDRSSVSSASSSPTAWSPPVFTSRPLSLQRSFSIGSTSGEASADPSVCGGGDAAKLLSAVATGTQLRSLAERSVCVRPYEPPPPPPLPPPLPTSLPPSAEGGASGGDSTYGEYGAVSTASEASSTCESHYSCALLDNEPLYQVYVRSRTQDIYSCSSSGSDSGYDMASSLEPLPPPLPQSSPPLSSLVSSPDAASVSPGSSPAVTAPAADTTAGSDAGVRAPILEAHRSLWCQLPAVISSGVLERLSSAEKRLQEAIFETVSSEASYVKSLSVLVHHFADEPLFCRHEAPDCLLSKCDYRELFSSARKVLHCSERFLSDLESAWQRDIMMTGICQVIETHASQRFGVYKHYCANQVLQDRRLKQLKQTNPAFIECLQRLEASPLCHSLNLHSFLMLPMQRVTRLPLLISAVLCRLDDSHAEHAQWRAAYNTVKKLAVCCDEEASKNERLEELISLNRQLIFRDMKSFPLVASHRWLVKKGEMTRTVCRSDDLKVTFGRKSTRQQTVHLFLFTDVLIVAKKKSDLTFVVLDYCMRNMIELHTNVDGNADRLLLTLLSNNEDKTVEMLLMCPVESERMRWVEAVTPRVQQTDTETIYESWDCPQVRVVQEYTAQQSDELALLPGDLLKVLRKVPDGWYQGIKLGSTATGWFPSWCCEEIASEHIRARHLRQRYQLLQLAGDFLQQQHKQRAT